MAADDAAAYIEQFLLACMNGYARTFLYTMDSFSDTTSGHPDANSIDELATVLGVNLRRQIMVTDSFHSINLRIEHASQDIHPHQAMQSLHDMYIRSLPNWEVRTTREREQRWMVNGE